MTSGCGRYAPSPTGPLHLGNLQTALAAWLQARIHGMRFILRIEDLDRGRCRRQWTEGIVRDLQRIGLDWDVGPTVSEPESYLQSRRLPLYRNALERLATRGLLFPCSCSRRDLLGAASAPHGPLGAVYPGNCRQHPLPWPRPWAMGADVDVSVRLRIDGGTASFRDELCGDLYCDLSSGVGDTVVYRRDGVFAYHLAVVVDDIDMQVTDVVRGADLVWSTFPQLSLYRGLHEIPPRYRHVPLRLDSRGRRMSKRAESVGLDALLERGLSIAAVVGDLAAGLGLVEPGQEITVGELLRDLDPRSFRDRLRAPMPAPDQVS